MMQVTLLATQEKAAIKKVLQDRRYKNRELEMTRSLQHQNVVDMKWFFYTNGQNEDEVYLNLVLEFIPETLYQVARHHAKANRQFPILHAKVRQGDGFACATSTWHVSLLG